MDNRGTSLTRLDSLNLGYRNSPDNQKLITKPGNRTQVNVALSGGNEKSKFYWNTSVLDQEGVVINSNFKRLSSRLKLDVTPNEKFSLGTVVNMTYEETNGISSGAVLANALNRIPYISVFEPNEGGETIITSKRAVRSTGFPNSSFPSSKNWKVISSLPPMLPAEPAVLTYSIWIELPSCGIAPKYPFPK